MRGFDNSFWILCFYSDTRSVALARPRCSFLVAFSTVYLIDTLVACLLIAFSILVPGLPGRGKVELAGPDIPPGWTYNPSSWIRRWLGIALALLGFFISRYLAAHQLGYIQHAWDPFFGDGSDKVTGSALSRSFPIEKSSFEWEEYRGDWPADCWGGESNSSHDFPPRSDRFWPRRRIKQRCEWQTSSFLWLFECKQILSESLSSSLCP